MSPEPRMQPAAFDRLRSALEETSWNRDFLAEYVTELSRHNSEEDIFHRLAFRSDNFAGPGAPSAFSALYEGMSLEDRTLLRRWWHEKTRREAYRHDDLGRRLSWRYLV